MPDRLPLINPGSHLLERYPVQCAVCGGEFHAAPSMLMAVFAVNIGSASCPGCHTYLHLEIAGDRMNSVRYSDYLAAINRQDYLTSLNSPEVAHAQ